VGAAARANRTRVNLRAIGAAALAVASLALPAATADPLSAATTFDVDAAAPLGPVNRDLVGVGWHYHAGAPIDAAADLLPRLVRIDASLEQISPAPGVLHLDNLLARVAEIRAIGGEPLVILSYMPAWLGSPRAYGRDPTRVPPSDPAMWEKLVYDVVHALATAEAPATMFEAWNEPDVPIFWQDLPTAWVDLAERTARTVARVEGDTGVDLQFGGPAMALREPVYLAAFLSRFRNPELPLDFVSWHYYGNYPFFGPDGQEFPAYTDPVYPVVGRRNPAARPQTFEDQVHAVRAWVEAGLAGSGRPMPNLFIDEWNMSAAGYDTRHGTHEGAAFAASALVAMQDAGLDAASFFKSGDTGEHPGDHGLVTVDGERKPAWWAFWLWQQLADTRVAVVGGSEGVTAIASRDGHRVTILVASFSASDPKGRDVELHIGGLDGTTPTATIRRIDADNASAAARSPLSVEDGRVSFHLPAQAVALVEVVAP
jgi:Glycosyl hydrolases family 39